MERFISLLLAFTVATAAATPGAKSGLESLTLTFDVSRCAANDVTAAGLKRPMDVIAAGLSTNKRYEAVVPARSGRGPLIVRFKVEPDAYAVGAEESGLSCVSENGGYIEIVLPGHPRTATVILGPCCADAPTASYLAGLVVPDIIIDIVRSSAVVACGQPMDATTFVGEREWSEIHREGNAYYTSIGDVLTGTLALQITRGARTAFLRLALRPGGSFGDDSYRRLDVDDTLFERASAHAGALYCPPD